MFTSGELFVGLWCVPVVLFIVLPLAMYSCWLVMRAGKQAKDAAGELSKSIHDSGETLIVKTAQPSAVK